MLKRFVILAASAAMLAVVGAAPTGASDPVITTTVQPLLGVSLPGVIPQVTAGQTIAYRITVTNGGGNTVSHVIFSDSAAIGTGSGAIAAAFVSDDSSLCSGSGATMTCSVGQMTVGASFSVRVAFTAPTTAGTLTNTVKGSLDPQTPNETNHRQTDTFTGAADASVVAAGDSLTSTYGFPSKVIKTSPISATHLQFTETDLPGTLSNGFGTPVQVSEAGAGPCPAPTCVPSTSQITIPDSEPVGGAINPKNPFVDPLTHALFPFTWQIQVDSSLVPNGVKPRYVYHDGVRLPACGAVSLAQTICVSAVTQDKKTKVWTGTGFALENGSYQFG